MEALAARDAAWDDEAAFAEEGEDGWGEMAYVRNVIKTMDQGARGRMAPPFQIFGSLQYVHIERLRREIKY
jgi:hypothetical protein